MTIQKQVFIIFFAVSLMAGGLSWSAPVTFNDPALLAAVKTQWESATGGTLSTPPQDTELANPLFTTLTANGLGITDLTGLQACTSLTELNLGWNQITSLAPISGLTSLLHLDVGMGVDLMDNDIDPMQTGTNLITDLSPLAGLVNLEYLSIIGNTGITSIAAISTLDSLFSLWLGSNPITSFTPLSDVADTLALLVFIDNGVKNSDIPIINGLVNLQGLGLLAEENLTDISGLTGISPSFIFAVLMAPITDISVVSNYTNLQMLEASQCQLTVLPDLSGLTGLREAGFFENQITDISGLTGNTSIEELDLAKNQITSISALQSCTGLTQIRLDGNQLTDIQPLLDNANAANFEWISLKDNPFAEGTPFCDENQLDQLKALAPYAGIESNAVCGPAFNLTLSINGTGETSPGPGVTAVAQNTWTYVNAYPISGSGQAFSSWTGDLTSTQMYTQLFMDSDKSVTANFVPGNWTLTINVTGGGDSNTWPNAGTYSYLNGQTANISSNNNSSSYFNGWSGDATGFLLSTSVLMDGNKTVTAAFASSGYQLTLHTQGNGNIMGFWGSGPFNYAAGASFDLQAMAYDSIYRFDHWTGNLPAGADPNTPVLPIVMDQNRDITAVFVQDAKTLTLIIEGGGVTIPSGSAAPGTQYMYSTGQTACLNAMSSAGVAFDHWEGDIGSASPNNQNICVTMDQDRTLTAVFVTANWNLTLQANGNGTTNPVPGVYGYVNGAYANFNYQLLSGGGAFSGWTGDIDSGQAQNNWVNVIMDRNRTVTANFIPGDWFLTLNTSGSFGGGTNPNPGTYAYLDGQTATISAWSNTSTYFSGWTGSITDDTPNISVVMDGNKTVTANYVSSGYALNVNTQGQGNINLNGWYYLASGTQPVLKANVWGGWVFSEWTGDLPVGADAHNPELPVLMDQDRSIIGVFIQDSKTLTVIIDGPGSTSPAGSAAPGTSYEYNSGQNVCVQALGVAEGAFEYWSGDIGGSNPTGNTVCVNMDQDRTITAHYTAANWSLTLVASGNGSTNPAPGTYGYLNGTWAYFSVNLLSGGDAFSHWSGDIGGTTPESFWGSITMDQNRTITANFTAGEYTLTLDKTGPSSGGVSPLPGTYAYLNGQTAHLGASSNSSAYFAGWSGDVDSDTPSLDVVMESNKAVTANFADSGYLLNVGTDGQGWVSLPNTSYFAVGTEPVINAHTQNGWEFDHWSGDLPNGADPNNADLPVLMDQNRTITAHFIQNQRTLTIIVVGQGATSPEGGPEPGIQHDYAEGSQAWVSAEMGAAGWAFSGWSGDIGSANPSNRHLSLIMDQDRTIIATYQAADWTLTLDYTGNGNTYPAPGSYGFMDGAEAEAVANIYNGGDAFNHWEGLPEDMDSDEPGHHFAIHDNMTLTAVFTPGDYTLTTTVAGGGTAEYLSHPAGSYQYMAGRDARLEVRPGSTVYWGGYSGDVNTYDFACALPMNANKNVTINLGTSGYELVVNQIGGGLTNPSGTSRFVAGATPAIHAIDQGSSLFDHWSGNLPAGVNPNDRDAVILMDQNRTIIANFLEADWYLYLQVQGNGTIAPAPGLYWYLQGSAFEVTATPGADTMFLRWTGNIPEGQDPASLTISGTMTQNREIIAVFVPQTVAVPDLSGMNQEQAEAVLMSAGLVLGMATQNYSSTVPAGQIISQNPAAGISVAYGSAVSVIISLGSCYTSIPNVEGLTQAAALTALAAANLSAGAITFEVSETVPEGQVISQNPVSGLVVECGTAVALVISGAGPEGGEEGEEGEGGTEGGTEGETGCHTADQDCNNLVNLSELLRVIQFFNSGGYHCEAGTEDGYAPGPGGHNCTPHASDYNTQDWLINLSELLRIIQFFNSGGYHYCPGENTEDGFCPGL